MPQCFASGSRQVKIGFKVDHDAKCRPNRSAERQTVEMHLHDSSRTFPLERVRRETIIAPGVVHLNNAGCALPPRQVLQTRVDTLTLEATIGGYEAARELAVPLADTYQSTATLLGANPSEIAFTASASDSWWRAFQSVGLRQGDRVLAGPHEFVSGGIGLARAKQAGIEVEYLVTDADGAVCLESLERTIDERVKLVCLTSYPMTNGLVNPAAEVGLIAKSVGSLYLVDATQGVGQAPTNVGALNADFVTATGRKWLRGMRGVGILYARDAVMPELVDGGFVDGASATWTSMDRYTLAPGAKRFEFGETSVAAVLGLGTSVDYALELGLDAIELRVQALAEHLRSGLSRIQRVIINDSRSARSGIVTFNVEGCSADLVSGQLSTRGFNVAAPPAAASRPDLERTGQTQVVRASAHYYNTADELDAFCAAVREIAAS